MDHEMYYRLLDGMTGKWAELRDMSRDNYVAKTLIDGFMATQGRSIDRGEVENMLLSAVILLIRDNEQFRKHTLNFMANMPSPMIVQNETPLDAGVRVSAGEITSVVDSVERLDGPPFLRHSP